MVELNANRKREESRQWKALKRPDRYLQGPQTTAVVSEFPTGDNTTKFD